MDKANILLIDANATDVQALTDVLNGSGFQISMTKSGAETFQHLDQSRPDIILLDARMPDLDGFEICRLLKTQENTKDIPVILITALYETTDQSKGFEVGGADYITRPFQRTEVLARVQAHLTIHRLQQDLQQMTRKMEELSLIDPLTGMGNRKYLSKYIHTDIAEVHRNYHEAFTGKGGARLANADIVFLLIDLDHFKAINDLYSHHVTDTILLQCRELLESVCRESDILVRWGEDMFLAVSRYSDQHYAQIIAERIKETFEDHAFDIGRAQPIHLTCSIGSASYPFLPEHPDYVNWEQVIAIANKGLSIAKKSGRNAFVNLMSTDQTVPDRLFPRIQEDLEQLIQTGELRVTTSIAAPKTLVFR